MLRHERPGHYDTVVANFFLNVFTEPVMEAVLARLATMLKPGGKLLIGDFSYPRGWITTRAMQRAYYYLSMFSFWLLGGTSHLHRRDRLEGDGEQRAHLEALAAG